MKKGGWQMFHDYFGMLPLAAVILILLHIFFARVAFGYFPTMGDPARAAHFGSNLIYLAGSLFFVLSLSVSPIWLGFTFHTFLNRKEFNFKINAVSTAMFVAGVTSLIGLYFFCPAFQWYLY